MKSIFRISLVWCFAFFQAYAQDFKEDMMSVYKSYQNLENISMKGKIQIFDLTQNTTKLESTKKLTYYKSGEKIFYSLDSYTMLSKKDFFLMVDANQKTLMLTDAPMEKLKSEPFKPSQIDSFLKQSNIVTFKGEESGIRHYQIDMNNNFVYRVDLYINIKINMVQKFIQYQKSDLISQHTKVVLDLENIQCSDSIDDNYFSEAKYVMKVKNQWQATNDYKHYKLVIKTQ